MNFAIRCHCSFVSFINHISARIRAKIEVLGWLLIKAAVCAFIVCFGIPSGAQQDFSAAEAAVVTKDIQQGIEKYIEQQTRLGRGYFTVPFNGRQLQLKLVRVHTEYLASLAPDCHFACVDMATIDADVYDIDFFLTGTPGAMTVTETTVHKLNGKPFYAWEQKPDKTWHSVPVENAEPRLLGVITGTDNFEFLYRATLPQITDNARMWVPLPTTDMFQTVEIKSIQAPGSHEILQEHKNANRVLFLKLGPGDSGKPVELRFQVRRLEKSVYPAQTSLQNQYLEPHRLVPNNEKFRSIAEKIVEGKNSDLARARAIYDHVIDQMRYMKYGPNWGNGDAVYACNALTGNCSDFHSYFIALCRAVNIPARFAIGAAIPSERNEGGIDGYHCWAEFCTDARWWPVDISEADKCSSLSSYYFGRNPANRIELSRGRDLVLEPGPASGPINFLAYPILEIGGSPAQVKTEFFFRRDT
jgi:CBS domain-containing protein